MSVGVAIGITQKWERSAFSVNTSYTNSRLQIKLSTYNEQEVVVARERVKDFKKWLE